MPSTELTFTVKLPIKSVWSFMSDRHEVGCLFPGCKGVKILNDLDSIWTVKMSFGPFTRIMEMKTHTTEFKEFEKLAWTAAGDHIISSGFVSLEKISEDETEVTYRVEGRTTGPLSALGDIVVAEKLRELAKKFTQNIKDQLEWQIEAQKEESKG
jgi:carbon monoxide dehydrogenase subunit G